METTVTASKLVLSTLFKLKYCLVVGSNGRVADRLYGLISHRHWVYDGTLFFFFCPTAVSLAKLLGEGSRALTSLPAGGSSQAFHCL